MTNHFWRVFIDFTSTLVHCITLKLSLLFHCPYCVCLNKNNIHWKKPNAFTFRVNNWLETLLSNLTKNLLNYFTKLYLTPQLCHLSKLANKTLNNKKIYRHNYKFKWILCNICFENYGYFSFNVTKSWLVLAQVWQEIVPLFPHYFYSLSACFSALLQYLFAICKFLCFMVF